MNNKKIKRPWGSYTVLNEGDNYKVKLIEVNPSARLSLQSHTYRCEHWTIIEGLCQVIQNNIYEIMYKSKTCLIPIKSKHRLINISRKKLLKIIEIQYGVCDENDITRYEDDYGRI